MEPQLYIKLMYGLKCAVFIVPLVIMAWWLLGALGTRMAEELNYATDHCIEWPLTEIDDTPIKYLDEILGPIAIFIVVILCFVVWGVRLGNLIHDALTKYRLTKSLSVTDKRQKNGWDL